MDKRHKWQRWEVVNMNGDIYGRGIAGATRGWEDLMRGIREGTQGMMQGLQTKELIKQQKREKEYIETKDRAEGIFQRFTQGLYNLKDMGAIDEYKNTVSKSDKALVLQMTGYSLDTIADTYTANLQGLETKAKEEIASKEKIWQERYKTEQAGKIEMAEISEKGRRETQEAIARLEAELTQDKSITPSQAMTGLTNVRKEISYVIQEIEDLKGKIAIYQTWTAKVRVSAEEKTELEVLETQLQEKNNDLIMLKAQEKDLSGKAGLPVTESKQPTLPWMSAPADATQTPEDIYKSQGF